MPKAAGLLPKSPVLPAVDVAPKAEVEALKVDVKQLMKLEIGSD